MPGSGVNSVSDNTILLIIKQYIYKCRCLSKPLDVTALKNTIINYHRAQKYIATGKGEVGLNTFNTEWLTWNNLIHNT